MRKRLITPAPETVRSRGEGWLDIDQAAIVEFTSEAEDYSVESAFVAGHSPGWRAGTPGSQTIRLVFDQPQKLRLISLVFEGNETARTQEFVLRWSPDHGTHIKRLCASSGMSARPKPTERSRNIKLTSQMSPCSN